MEQFEKFINHWFLANIPPQIDPSVFKSRNSNEMDGTKIFRQRSCTNWCYCKGDSSAIKPGPVRNATSQDSCVLVSTSCRKVDGVVAWLMNGVAAAFFMSLERCSCIHIDTKDDADDGDDIEIELLGPDFTKDEQLYNSSRQEDEQEFEQRLLG